MSTSATEILVLESGDHLTRAEFHRRYCASPRKFKAELVERVVYVASPVSRRHGLSHAVAMAWLSLYWERHPEGAPQLVVEIAASSASYNLHEKLRVYRRNRVLEYVVWPVLDGSLKWFRLQDGEDVPIEPDANGVIESSAFPGLRLAVDRLLALDPAGVRAALDPPAE